MEQLSTLEKYGPVGVIAVVFAAVIVVLWAEYKKQRNRNEKLVEAQEKERGKWDVDRAELSKEYERKIREGLEAMQEELRAERKSNREHEDKVLERFEVMVKALRDSFEKMMEELSEEIAKGNDAHVAVLQKFYDRFVGPSARGRY
jgi:flagellar biosynthesis/type III secretory pathway M-ring protein FliF/YscJ